MPAIHMTVTPIDDDRTARNLELTRNRPLESALRLGISDPGAFLPRRTSGAKGAREYEDLSSWAARACALIVGDRIAGAL